MSCWHRHVLDPVHTVYPAATPYDTPQRRALVDRVRAFAMEEVLPVANELDPRHEDIPETLLVRNTTEFAVERYWRDARLTTIFEGTSQIQRRSISDGLLAAAPAGVGG